MGSVLIAARLKYEMFLFFVFILYLMTAKLFLNLWSSVPPSVLWFESISLYLSNPSFTPLTRCIQLVQFCMSVLKMYPLEQMQRLLRSLEEHRTWHVTTKDSSVKKKKYWSVEGMYFLSKNTGRSRTLGVCLIWMWSWWRTNAYNVPMKAF